MLCLRWPWWGKYDPTGHAVWLKKMKNKNIFLHSLAFQLLSTYTNNFYYKNVFKLYICLKLAFLTICSIMDVFHDKHRSMWWYLLILHNTLVNIFVHFTHSFIKWMGFHSFKKMGQVLDFLEVVELRSSRSEI